MAENGLRIDNPPNQGGASPKQESRVVSGQHDDKPLPSRQHPGRADVAVQAGLKEHQQKSDLAHPAAEVFASQAMRELVDGTDKQSEHHELRQPGGRDQLKHAAADLPSARNGEDRKSVVEGKRVDL